MKLLVSVCAVALFVSGSAFAGMKAMKEQDLMDLENAWSKAIVAKDTATISAIIADDWIGQNDSGQRETKVEFLADVKSGTMAASMMNNRDMTARIIRGIGIVQGADDERSSYKGRDTSGAYTWTDVFANRDGTWQVVASQLTKVRRMK